MTVIALDGLVLTDKARGELGSDADPPIPSWCASLWGGNPVHQCVRRPRHDGVCRCVCGSDRADAEEAS